MGKGISTVLIIVAIVAIGVAAVSFQTFNPSIKIKGLENTKEENYKCDTTQKPREFSTDEYYTGPLIDSHMHFPTVFEVPTFIFNSLGFQQFATLGKDITVDELICSMDKGNIKSLIGFHLTQSFNTGQIIDTANKIDKRHPGRVHHFIMPSPFLSPIFPPNDLDSILKSNPGLFKGYGELGFYLEPLLKYSPDDEILLQTYDVAEKHNLIVMIHPDGHQKYDLKRAFENNPNVIFFIHGGESEHYIQELMEYPNVFYSLDANLFDNFYAAKDKEEFLPELRRNFYTRLNGNVNKWKTIIEDHPDRFTWGMDRALIWHYDEEVVGLLEEFSRAFIGKLSPEVQEKFAYQNAERMLEKRKEKSNVSIQKKTTEEPRGLVGFCADEKDCEIFCHDNVGRCTEACKKDPENPICKKPFGSGAFP